MQRFHLSVKVDILISVDEFNISARDESVAFLLDLALMCGIAELGDILIVDLVSGTLPCMIDARNFGADFLG